MQHIFLAEGAWQKLSLPEQLGNIGSEVGRALRAKTLLDKTAAAGRALELCDLTLADTRWHGRGSEIARVREVLCDYLFGSNIFGSTPAELENYFGHFALVARLKR